MKRMNTAVCITLLAVSLAACGGRGGGAGEGSGVTDKTITLGGTYPLSGPAAAYGTIAAGAEAYFEMVNADGGVSGRKIVFKVLDDAYDPAKALTNARQLVEKEGVFAIFNPGGTAHNIAIRDYTQQQEVPQVLLNTGASTFGKETDNYPWISLGVPDYGTEAAAYVEYLKRVKPDAKVSILFQNDTFGTDQRDGFVAAANKANISVVAEESYEPTDPSVDSQVTKLSTSGADTIFNIATPKFAAQSIKRTRQLGWKPLQILTGTSASIPLVLDPAGPEASMGVVSSIYLKDPNDSRWANDADVAEYEAAMKKYAPRVPPTDLLAVRGYEMAAAIVDALRTMETPTRQGLMDALNNMDVHLPMLLPETDFVTGDGDPYPIETLQIVKFDGTSWVPDGPTLSPSGRK